jgi:hypothetical protein
MEKAPRLSIILPDPRNLPPKVRAAASIGIYLVPHRLQSAFRDLSAFR